MVNLSTGARNNSTNLGNERKMLTLIAAGTILLGHPPNIDSVPSEIRAQDIVALSYRLPLNASFAGATTEKDLSKSMVAFARMDKNLRESFCKMLRRGAIDPERQQEFSKNNLKLLVMFKEGRLLMDQAGRVDLILGRDRYQYTLFACSYNQVEFFLEKIPSEAR